MSIPLAPGVSVDPPSSTSTAVIQARVNASLIYPKHPIVIDDPLLLSDFPNSSEASVWLHTIQTLHDLLQNGFFHPSDPMTTVQGEPIPSWHTWLRAASQILVSLHESLRASHTQAPLTQYFLELSEDEQATLNLLQICLSSFSEYFSNSDNFIPGVRYQCQRCLEQCQTARATSDKDWATRLRECGMNAHTAKLTIFNDAIQEFSKEISNWVDAQRSTALDAATLSVISSDPPPFDADPRLVEWSNRIAIALKDRLMAETEARVREELTPLYVAHLVALKAQATEECEHEFAIFKQDLRSCTAERKEQAEADALANPKTAKRAARAAKHPNPLLSHPVSRSASIVSELSPVTTASEIEVGPPANSLEEAMLEAPDFVAIHPYPAPQQTLDHSETLIMGVPPPHMPDLTLITQSEPPQPPAPGSPELTNSPTPKADITFRLPPSEGSPGPSSMGEPAVPLLSSMFADLSKALLLQMSAALQPIHERLDYLDSRQQELDRAAEEDHLMTEDELAEGVEYSHRAFFNTTTNTWTDTDNLASPLLAPTPGGDMSRGGAGDHLDSESNALPSLDFNMMTSDDLQAEKTSRSLQCFTMAVQDAFLCMNSLPLNAPFPHTRVRELECFEDDYHSFCNAHLLDPNIPFDEEAFGTFARHFRRLEASRKTAFNSIHLGTTYIGTRSIARPAAHPSNTAFQVDTIPLSSDDTPPTPTPARPPSPGAWVQVGKKGKVLYAAIASTPGGQGPKPPPPAPPQLVSKAAPTPFMQILNKDQLSALTKAQIAASINMHFGSAG